VWTVITKIPLNFPLFHYRITIFTCYLYKVKYNLLQALKLCTGHTAHRGSKSIALLFLDHGTRRGWGVSVTPRPICTSGKEPVPIVQEAGWVWTGAENLAPTGIRSPDPPARRQSLYQLSYPSQTKYYRTLRSQKSDHFSLFTITVGAGLRSLHFVHLILMSCIPHNLWRCSTKHFPPSVAHSLRTSCEKNQLCYKCQGFLAWQKKLKTNHVKNT